MYPYQNPNLQFSAGMANFGAVPYAMGTPVPPVATPSNTGSSMVTVNPQVGAQVGPDAGTSATPGFFGKGGTFEGLGGLEGLATLGKGLASIGQAYAAIKSLGIAKDQLAFSKQAYNTNLQNQRQTYNTSLEDRTRARFHTEGRSSSDVDAYLAKHSL